MGTSEVDATSAQTLLRLNCRGDVSDLMARLVRRPPRG